MQKCTHLNKLPFDSHNEINKKLKYAIGIEKKIKIFSLIRIDLLFFHFLKKMKFCLDFLGKKIQSHFVKKIVFGLNHPYDHLPFSKKYISKKSINNAMYYLFYNQKKKKFNQVDLFYLRTSKLEIEKALSSNEDESEYKGNNQIKKLKIGKNCKSCDYYDHTDFQKIKNWRNHLFLKG